MDTTLMSLRVTVYDGLCEALTLEQDSFDCSQRQICDVLRRARPKSLRTLWLPRVQRVVALASGIRRRSPRDCRPASKVHPRVSECVAPT